MGLRYLWLKPLPPGILPSPMFPVRSKSLGAGPDDFSRRDLIPWTHSALRDVLAASAPLHSQSDNSRSISQEWAAAVLGTPPQFPIATGHRSVEDFGILGELIRCDG
jgi:hypothetical protein